MKKTTRRRISNRTSTRRSRTAGGAVVSTSARGTTRKSMRTGTKVAIVAGAGALAATAAGLATSERGRRLSRKVGARIGAGVNDLVRAGKKTLKNPNVRRAMESGLGSVVGSTIPRRMHNDVATIARAAGAGSTPGSMRERRHGASHSTRSMNPQSSSRPRNRTGSRARGAAR